MICTCLSDIPCISHIPLGLFSASRTRVIDDQSDYFSVDADRWLSSREKEALRKKDRELREEKYGSRKNRSRAVTLDIGGRQVREEEQASG